MTSRSPIELESSRISFPPDIISHIAKFCLQPTLLNLIRVSHSSHDVAIPFLYKNIHLETPDRLFPLTSIRTMSSFTSPHASKAESEKVRPANPHSYYIQIIDISAHHQYRYFADISTPISSTIKTNLPQLRSIAFHVDTAMYHWPYGHALLRSLSPSIPEEIIFTAGDVCSVLYWALASLCWDSIPVGTKRVIFRGDADETIKRRPSVSRGTDGWGTGGLCHLGYVRGNLKDKAEVREIEVVLDYVHGEGKKPGAGGLSERDIEDVATLAMLVRKVVVIYASESEQSADGAAEGEIGVGDLVELFKVAILRCGLLGQEGDYGQAMERVISRIHCSSI